MSVNEKEKHPEQGKKKGNRTVIIAVCVVVIAALIGVIIYLVTRNTEPEKRNVVVNEDNVDEVIKNLPKEDAVPAGYYEMNMNTTWNFKDGRSTSENAVVKNNETNTNDVYFDVTLAETEELIYSSPVIPIGSELKKIALDKELNAGTYDCVCTYHLVDENQKTLSTLKISLTIVVAK